MNWTDAVVLVILAISTIVAYKTGFIRTCVHFFSNIVALILSYKLYPFASEWLRNSGWFNNIKSSIESTLQIEKTVNEMALTAQTSLINDLELPHFIKSALIENNNTEVYSVLNVSQLEDYISSYIANICINIVAMIGIFIIVLIALKIATGLLDIISKLPVLNSINKLMGAVLGFAKGVLIVWILCMVVTFFYSKPTFQPVLLAIQQSTVAKFFYNNNLLISMVTEIFV